MSDIKDGLKWLPEPFVLSTCELNRKMLRDAYQFANKYSPDPSTKNGAILVNIDGDSISYGVNKFPDGVIETEERLTNKEIKYRLVVHAENGAVFNAAKNGKSINGATLYCPFYACSECAKAIIQSGIEVVVGHAQLMALASEHTVWVKSIVDAWKMLHEAGVYCALYDGVIGVTTRFNGQDMRV